MDWANVETADLARLLRLPIDDERVVAFLGPRVTKVRARSSHYGFLSFKKDGVDVVFQRAPWVVPAEEVKQRGRLHLAAFHFHREGHENYREYRGQLPRGLQFRDPHADIVFKMGESFATGGGGTSNLLPRISHWMKYQFEGVLLHLQMDDDDRLEMVTLMTPPVDPAA